MSLIEVAKVGEISTGTMKVTLVDGREILIARIDEKYYAADNRCPHMGGKLSQGKLEGAVVTCPRHSSQFDLRDGKVVRWLKGSGIVSAMGRALKSPKRLPVYNVKVEDDGVMIEI